MNKNKLFASVIGLLVFVAGQLKITKSRCLESNRTE